VAWVKWKLASVRLEIVLISTLDSCTVLDEHAIGSKSFWIHQMELLRDVGQMEARLGLFGDNVNLDTR
jgi:hypothetical protein